MRSTDFLKSEDPQRKERLEPGRNADDQEQDQGDPIVAKREPPRDGAVRGPIVAVEIVKTAAIQIA